MYSPSIQILLLGVIGIVRLLSVWGPAARDGGGDPVPERLGRVSRSPWQGRYGARLDRGRGLPLPEVVEEQGGREYGGHRVGSPGAGDVGRRPMDGFEQRGGRFRVEVGAGGGAEAAGDGRAQVGEDVAEQVVGDDHVEPSRVVDQVQAGGVGV